jgi:hypothetical protein
MLPLRAFVCSEICRHRFRPLDLAKGEAEPRTIASEADWRYSGFVNRHLTPPANTICRLAFLVAAREQAAIHHNGLPGYVAGCPRREKHRHICDVLRFSYPTHRYKAGGLF